MRRESLSVGLAIALMTCVSVMVRVQAGPATAGVGMWAGQRMGNSRRRMGAGGERQGGVAKVPRTGGMRFWLQMRGGVWYHATVST
jgi:hypothetical protein